MPITKEEKKSIIEKYGKNPKDTGSPEVQIALLSKRIAALTEHFKQFKKDNNSKRGLLRLIGRRKRLLNYLHRTNPESYHKILKELGI